MSTAVLATTTTTTPRSRCRVGRSRGVVRQGDRPGQGSDGHARRGRPWRPPRPRASGGCRARWPPPGRTAGRRRPSRPGPAPTRPREQRWPGPATGPSTAAARRRPAAGQHDDTGQGGHHEQSRRRHRQGRRAGAGGGAGSPDATEADRRPEDTSRRVLPEREGPRPVGVGAGRAVGEGRDHPRQAPGHGEAGRPDRPPAAAVAGQHGGRHHDERGGQPSPRASVPREGLLPGRPRGPPRPAAATGRRATSHGVME